MLARLGRWCHNRRGIVVITWVLVLFVIGGISGATGSGFSTAFTPPDVESARGFELLDEHFGGQNRGDGGRIVFRSTGRPVTDPAVQEQMAAFLAAVDEIEPIEIVSPYSPQGARQISQDGTIAYATAEIPGEVTIEEAAAITKDVDEIEPTIDGVQIEYGGQLFAEFVPPESEVLGLGFAIVILILAFGSVLSMGLPVGTAAGGIGLGVTVVSILSNIVTMPDFTTVLGIMIGLGVGIDYALFIVVRYREGLHAGFTSERAVFIALDTAGRAVLFAGTTVVISLLGMLLMQLGFVNGLAIGAAITVAFTMMASLTLLPALLGFVRERVEVTRYRGLIAAGLVALGLVGVGLAIDAAVFLFPLALVVLVLGFVVPALKRELPRRAPKPAEQTLPYRWSRVVQRHPWAAVISGFAVLLVLATPLLSIRLGFSDEGNFPEDSTTRKAYDMLAEGFGPGFNGPLVLITELPDSFEPANFAGLTEFTQRFQAIDGVAFASPPVPNDPNSPTAVLWQVVPETSPQDEATSDLVHELRDAATVPDQIAGVERPLVTGFVAVSVDFSKYLGDRLPLFVGVVLFLSFLLLMAVFRSLLVPLKAVVMNLVSIGAAYGLVVAVFQWGWLKDVVGIGKGGPIEPFVPMMMFAIVFGLSMDYEVFLLSRMKEEYDRGSSNDRAVADGLAATARVITAAAAIMVFVFGSFLLESDRIIKLMGVGLASAVLLDATIVRMWLVPATMELLGDRNWWLPGWLSRLLPKIDVEGLASAEEISHAAEDAVGDEVEPTSTHPEPVP